MLPTAIANVLLWTSLVRHSLCWKLENFILDFAELYSSPQVTLIAKTDDDLLDLRIVDRSAAYISYTSPEISAVVEHIVRIQKELEVIFFLGSDHSDLLGLLDNSTGIFHSNTVSVMVEHDELLGINLRLDTNVLICNAVGISYNLKEVYAIKNGPKITRSIGSWIPGLGLQINSPILWERRANLLNASLTNSVLPYSVITKLAYDQKGKVTEISGIMQDPFTILQASLNFSIKSVSPIDGKWGALKDDNKSWSGMIGELVEGKADISTAGLSRSLERNDVVEWGITSFEYVNTLIQPIDTSVAINVWVYVTIFPLLAWSFILVMLLMVGVLFTIIGKYNESIDLSIMDGILITFLYLLQLSHMKSSLFMTRASKIGLSSWALGCFLLFSYYTADP